MLAAPSTIGKSTLNPYEPIRNFPTDKEVPDGSSLSRFIVKVLWLLPIVFAVFFMLPVLIFGLLDRNLNPLDVNSLLLQGLVNFFVGDLEVFS